MFPKRLAPLLVAAFALFLNFSMPKLTSGQKIPSPQALKNEMRLRALTQPGETTPEKAPVGPAPQFIATSTQRTDRDRAEVRVYRRGQPVELFPSFHELLTATPAHRQVGLDRLAGRSVALVPSEKRADQRDILTGVGGVGELILAGNIFKVRQVLLSSRKNPLEVRVDGQIHRLKPGQALLVL
jgi:hypothetical protein